MDWLGIVILLVGAIGIGYGWVVGVLGRELEGMWVLGCSWEGVIGRLIFGYNNQLTYLSERYDNYVMNKCLKCQNEYEAKRSTSKFCSDKCRVAYNREQKKVQKIQEEDRLTQMFNSLMQAISAINAKNGLPEPVAFVGVIEEHKEAALSFEGLKALISAATSEAQLKSAWDLVEKSFFDGWKLKQLTRLKDDQQTKLYF